MKVLITGIAGQDGSYLAEHLLNGGAEVHGIVRPASNRTLENLRAVEDRVHLWSADVTDASSMDHVIRVVAPDHIYNLAALSFVPDSWRMPASTFAVNTLGLANILEVVLRFKTDIRVYQASTSEIFGDAGGRTLVDELAPMTPISPYGVSKLAAHRLAQVYRRAYGLHVSCGILFNHESPRRAPSFLSRKVARAFALATLGMRVPLVLGDMSAKRDWGWAPEYVRAMALMLAQDQPGDYVVATGRTATVEDLVTAMAEAAAEFSGTDANELLRLVEQDQSQRRPVDLRELAGDARLARTTLGWLPHTDLRGIARAMVEAELYPDIGKP